MKNKKVLKIMMSILILIDIFLGAILIIKGDKELYIMFIPLLMILVASIINFFINYDLIIPKGEKRKIAMIGNIVIFAITILGFILIDHMLINVLTYEEGHKIAILGFKVSDDLAYSFVRIVSSGFYPFALSIFYLFLAPINNKKTTKLK